MNYECSLCMKDDMEIQLKKYIKKKALLLNKVSANESAFRVFTEFF